MQINYQIPQSEIRPLWIGVQMPTGINPDLYQGYLTVTAENTKPQTISINIQLSDRILTDKGDGDMYRLSRLRWLNSELACNDEIVKPFQPLTVENKTISCLGRKVTLNEFGLPANIDSYFTETVTEIGQTPTPILNAPFQFVLEQNQKNLPWKNKSFHF